MSSPGSTVMISRTFCVGTWYSSSISSSRRFVRSRASSASSAAAMSDGWADAQKSFAKIACSRCSPSRAWQRSPPCSRHGYLSRQYQQRVDCKRLPPIELMLRSCGDAASRHASRSASGICSSSSSSASVVPAPIRFPSTPRGMTPRTSTSLSAWRMPSRSSGTTSVPPCSARPPSRSSSEVALTSSNANRLLLPFLLARFRLAQRAQHLLARDRQLVHVGAGRVADRVRDRRRDRHDRRLAEPLRTEARQMLVRLVDELAHDLGHVRDRRHPVGVEALREDAPRLEGHQPLLGERVADALDDPALDLALRTERIDDAADVVRGGDTLDAHLAGLDVDGDFDDLYAEREHAHAGRVRPPRSLAEDLRVFEQAHELLERLREVAVGGDDHPVLDVEYAFLEVVPLRGDLDQLPLHVGCRRAHGRAHRRRRRRARRERRVRAPRRVAEHDLDAVERDAERS